MSILDYTILTALGVILLASIVLLVNQDTDALAKQCAASTNHTYETCLHEISQ